MGNLGNHAIGTRENAAIRRLQVLDLRKTGHSLRAIGATVGISSVQASRDLQRALHDLAEQQNTSTLEWRQLEIERLDSYLLALEPAIASGDVRAIEAGIKLSESRRKMLGVDMPGKVAPTTPDGEGPYDANRQPVEPADVVQVLGILSRAGALSGIPGAGTLLPPGADGTAGSVPPDHGA